METASTSYREDSGPATYARGYQPLLQEDPEISVIHGPRNTVPEQPVVMQALPPYTPEQQSSQYTPAPQSFNPQQQSSLTNVITTQPGGVQYIHQVNSGGNDVVIFSLIVAILCALMSPITLVCSIPAVCFAAMSMEGQDMERRAEHTRASFIFSVAAFVFGLLITVAAIVYIINNSGNEYEM